MEIDLITDVEISHSVHPKKIMQTISTDITNKTDSRMLLWVPFCDDMMLHLLGMNQFHKLHQVSHRLVADIFEARQKQDDGIISFEVYIIECWWWYEMAEGGENESIAWGV